MMTARTRRGARHAQRAGVVAALVSCAWIGAHAASAPPPAPSHAVASSAPGAPTIPPAQPTTLAPSDPATVAELEALLAKLAGADEPARKAALSALADQDATMLGAIAGKLASLRKSADREGMGRLLEGSKRRGRTATGGDAAPKTAGDDEEADGIGAASDGGRSLLEAAPGDWLASVLARPEPDKGAYRDLVAVLALERVCVCIGTTAAAREIIAVYTSFGDLMRPDVQRQLARLGERALPALIEAKYHDSRMVRTWAERRLDALGKVIPSEAVRTSDNQVLADILRAYGRAREVEAVRAIVTFANSDRLQVREAAREALGQIGEPARWQLRDAFENLTGKKPDAAWDWKRIALELFAAYDRSRLAEIYKMMDEGLELHRAGKAQEAVASFDKVLARAPMFERRAEMVPAYLERARQLRDKDPVAALLAVRKAEAIDPSGPRAKEAKAEQLVIEAEELATRGLVDVTLLERAIELDPGNERARAALDRAVRDVESRQAVWRRYAAAVAIGVIALAAMVFVALRPKRGGGRKDPGAREPSGSDAGGPS
jgi:tetratricopeptide (TPR) repeat protein